jgi:hypothetical protein
MSDYRFTTLGLSALLVTSGLVFSTACGDDPAKTDDNNTTGGSSAGGSSAGGSSAGGSSAGGSSAGGSSAGGSSAGGSSAGGSSAGGSGGSGGSSGGSGGSGGSASVSAECMTFCDGADGVVTKCGANGLPAEWDTEEKCHTECASFDETAFGCWQTHLSNIAEEADKATHCGHATGAPGNGECGER